MDSSLYFSDGFSISLGLIAAVTILYIIQKLKSFSDVPPGSWGMPIIGYLPFLSKKPHEDFVKISKKYGKIFSLQLGSRFLVVLNSHDTIKSAFKTENFDGRVQAGKEREFLDNGIVLAEGETWRQQRRFLLSAMKDIGLGKNTLEEFVRNEILIAEESLIASKGEPYDIKIMTENISCNVIANFVFGQQFSQSDDTCKHALLCLSEGVENLNFFAAFNSFPHIIKYIPDKLTGLKLLVNLKQQIYSFTDKIILQHEQTYNDDHVRDLIDIYFKTLQDNKNKGTNLYNKIGDNFLRENTTHLFIAGTHTTNNMMSWCFRLLAAYPDIQIKMQAEMDNIIGRERVPTLNDRPNLPYTEAVILEAYRYITLVPVSFYHRVTDDIVIEGYRIPKNSCSIANLWNVHHSEEIWREPDRFNPKRFLDKSGKLIPEIVKNVIPFSIGRRNCVAEPIARAEIFLVVTNLVHKFFFTLPKGEVWKFQPDHFIPSITCQKYIICASPRT